MIYVVTQENRRHFRHALMEMHRQRKTMFVDTMRWKLDAPEGLEIDAYDAEDATYLIAADTPRGPVLASARLLPTERRHLMSDVFPHLCSDGVPSAPSIWEASRFCPAPETAKGEARRSLLGLMIAGILETGLLFGIEQVSFVAGAALAPLARDAGWTVRPLGPCQRYGNDRVSAMLADVDAAGLKRVRLRHGLEPPITRLVPGALQLAA